MSSTCLRAAARFLLSSCALCVLIAGCTSEEQFLPVKGRVLVNGQPLKGAGGAIAFVPDPAKGNASKHEPRAEIKAEGEYELKTVGRLGAPPGWYKVQVMAQMEPLGASKDPYAIPKWAVPIEYTKVEQTPISIEVVAQPGPDAYDLKVKK